MSTGGCTITGWGAAVPPTVVTNEDLKSIFETTDEWIVERSGIRSRHAATGPFVESVPTFDPRELGTTATLAVESGRRALDAAGVSPADLGALILCTTTPDLAIPATSSAVAGAMGITGGAMDLNAACAGFTYGLITAGALVAAGIGPVLLVGAETLSRATNWNDRTNAFLFGDGAGAVVLEPVEGRGSLLGWHLGVDGTLVDLLYAEHGSGMVMRGQEVFRKAVRATADSARAALDHARVDASEIALFIPHQANERIMDAVAERLGLPEERVASVIEWTGNTSSASIPLALVDAAEHDRLHEGDLVLLSGFGAGMTFASAVWRWARRPGP
ncbi:MAG TPA: beta-ketoacyl-ACP synthase III [Acidimicrobiales bacterium]|jgi:3-oxoacyl-[acyl-carrier-protein] synthase-3